MKSAWISTFAFLAASCWAPIYAAPAASAGTNFPATINVDTHVLVLNGVGTRKATIFKIKVYDAALYLEKKSSNAQEILDSAQLKRVDLVFLRDIDRGKISEAWQESIQKNCGTNCETLKTPAVQLSQMMQDIKKRDSMAFLFSTDHVDVWVKGKPAGTLTNPAFGRVMLSSWLGPNPPNEDMKKGMLGSPSP